MRGKDDPSLLTDAPRPLLADVQDVILAGRFGSPISALRELDAVLAALDTETPSPDAETPSPDADRDQARFMALYGRALMLRLAGAPAAETLAGCEELERAAPPGSLWTAIARALRAVLRLERGEAGLAMTDLARIDLAELEADTGEEEGAGDEADCPARHRLLDTLAAAFLRLRLYDQLEHVRGWLESLTDRISPADRATHWTRWAIEVATRSLEPLARGEQTPDLQLLERAAAIAGRTLALDAAEVPAALRDGARIVASLEHAWAGRARAALALRPDEALRTQRETGGQLAVLAAMRATIAAGDASQACRVDERAHRPRTLTLPNLVLEVARARERLTAERAVDGDVVPVLHRLSDLLVQLSWQGMSLVPDTARQVLEHQELRTESRTDPLTGTGNRRALAEDLRHMLRFTPLPLALVMLDVDDFKAVNDRHTHVVGDEVLRQVAAALVGALRPTDRVSRYGGDEFVALLPGTDEKAAAQVAATLQEAVAQVSWAAVSPGLAVRITAGHAVLHTPTGRRPDGDAERLLLRADQALLTAKRHRADAPPGRDEHRVVDLREHDHGSRHVVHARPVPVLRSTRLPRIIDLSGVERPTHRS